MNTTAKLDIGPLTWVKGEIDLALTRAFEALEQHDAGSGDTPHLKAARAHLHQAHGALSIVGMDGITRFSEALERLLDAVEEGKVPFQPAASEVARRGITAIQHYLEDLVAGRPDQPLRLLPVYQAITEATGLPTPSPTDLFFPDLTLRPPRREHEPLPIEPMEFIARAKTARLKYERGLLKWFKNDSRGVAEMRDALATIEGTQSQPAARAYWWAALAFLDALSENAVEPGFGTRRVCARIDIQIKRLIEGSRSVAERLMRDTLYYVAIAGPAGEHADFVRSVFQLNTLIPSSQEAADIEPLRPVLRACREQIAPAMEDWNRFCAGTAAALPQFHDRIRHLADGITQLQHADFSRLGHSILKTADELRRAPLAHNEALALEVATALLLTDHALEHFQLLDAEFADQCTTIANRLDAALRAQPLASMEIPHLDEMSRQAQEKLLLAQVVREIQSNLGHIEQTLDAFFRDPARAGELYGLAKPIRQVEGALTVLGQDRAVDVLRECEAAIENFSQPTEEPKHEAFEDVADKLSALGFFVEQLQHGPADIDQFLRPMSAAVPTEPKEITPEIELERAKRLTKTLVGALRNKPEDQTLRGEIRHSLEVVRENAELVDDTALAEQASAAIVAIESEQPSSEIADVIAQLTPVDVLTVPSAEATRLVEATSEEIDAELLDIFIEEAHEVLATIGNELPKLAAQPHDRETLTTVRRGFHTLKGSGRMVGLSDLGEAAWAVEQVLNRWLQQDLEATPALLEMLRQAHDVFGNWVVQLESGGGIRYDAAELVASCESLKLDVASQALAQPASSADTQVAAPEVLQSTEAIDALPDVPPQPEIVDEAANESPVEVDPALGPDSFLEEADQVAEPESIADIESICVEPAAPVLRLVTSPAPEPEEEGVLVGDQLLSPALYDLYVREARDYIGVLIHELGLGGRPRPALVRAAHTLAGISATADIAPVQRLGHALEMALNRLDTVGTAPTEAQQLLLARSVGALEGMVGAVANKRMPQHEEALAADLDTLSPEIPAPAQPEPQAVQSPTDRGDIDSLAPAESSARDLPPTEDHVERRQLHLPDELDDQLLPIFLEEAIDLMNEIGSGLREWRGHPNDPAIAERLQRALHTLKGSARMAGAMSIGELVHSMETRIEQAVASNALTPAFLDSLDASFDRVSLLMERIQAGPSAPDEPIIPQVDLLQGNSTAAAVTSSVSMQPLADPARPDQQEGEAVARNMLRVRADIVDKLVNEAGEIAIARGRIEGEMRSLKGALLDLTENVIRLRNQLREIEIQAELQMQSREAAVEKDLQFDPLEFDRFTRFQELTRMMAESVNDVATSQQSLLQNLDHADAALIAQARLNREHSQALMNVRMVPFNTLADRLYRIVRQTAKELDKRANLDIRGGQTELDRSVLEKMTGPIEHLLRNSVAHGLEPVEQRRTAGKADIGEISLRVGQEGNEIVIELADDGRGLDFERIRSRAIEGGLLAADEEPTTEELTQLIFQPGFTTAETVTSIAGRGVGMDVVRNEAAGLGGRIRVDSTAGHGTRFQIYLPLTLAVTQAVLVKSGSRHYAIPSSMIAQVREMKPDAIAAVRAEGATTWLGDRYPWYYLPRLLGNATAQPEPARRHWLLLLRAGDQRTAVEVDGLIGNQELVVKNVGPQLARIVGIAGATVLGDGEIVLILNPVALAGRSVVSLATSQPQAIEPSQPAESAAVSTGVVMVVDDSLTVRKITSRLLAREGYHVLLAKDGVDALEQLIDMVPDVMLVDIEMPRMDGFDLTRNVRADERLRNIPIIMITSRIADKHRNYAKAIGVNHYLGKPYDEEELLGLIAGYSHKDA